MDYRRGPLNKLPMPVPRREGAYDHLDKHLPPYPLYWKGTQPPAKTKQQPPPPDDLPISPTPELSNCIKEKLNYDGFKYNENIGNKIVEDICAGPFIAYKIC
jgi:hypothetical protein